MAVLTKLQKPPCEAGPAITLTVLETATPGVIVPGNGLLGAVPVTVNWKVAPSGIPGPAILQTLTRPGFVLLKKLMTVCEAAPPSSTLALTVPPPSLPGVSEINLSAGNVEALSSVKPSLPISLTLMIAACGTGPGVVGTFT